jgi:drug/metabolite transporter (DMT)-like permease
MTPTSQRAKLILSFATIYLVWGSTYAVASIGVHELPPLLFGGLRFLSAGVLLALTAVAMGQRFNLDAREWRYLGIVAVGSVFIPNGCTNWAMQYVASNQTAILNASAALWIALFATQGRRAHALDRRTVIGLVIGFAGASLILWPEGDLDLSHFGMQLLILFAVFVWSATTVYIRNAHSKLDLLPFSAIQMFLGGLMMTGAGLAIGEGGDWHWSTPGLLAMAYLTVFSSCLAYTAYSWLAKNTTPAMVGTYSYVNPAIAAVLGWWFLGEQLGPGQIIGMAVMFAGVALVSWPQKEQKRLDEDQQKDPSTAGCG